MTADQRTCLSVWMYETLEMLMQAESQNTPCWCFFCHWDCRVYFQRVHPNGEIEVLNG